MLLTIIKKSSALNRLKLALNVLRIIVINLLPVFQLIASAQTPTPSPTFKINLQVCVKDETGTLVTEKDKEDKPVSLKIVGGAAIANVTFDKPGCAVISRKLNFTSNKEYILSAEFQGENGVKMTARHFDPSSYQTEEDKAPGIIDIIIKDGVSVVDKDGQEIYYSKSNIDTSVSPANTAAPDTSPTGNVNNTGSNENTGNSNGNSTGYTNASILITGILSLIALLILIFRLIIYPPSMTFQTNEAHFDKESLQSITSEVKNDIIRAINNKQLQLDFSGFTQQLKTLIDDAVKQKTEIPATGNEQTAERKFGQTVSETHFTGGSTGDDQMQIAQAHYKNLNQGANISRIELQPAGETTPENMVGQQAIKFFEQLGGKYVAFPLEGKSNEAWLFPAVKYKFSENSFSLVFPNLTKEEYEGGNITPRKAFKQSNNETWLIV